jgi:hypothetical protein
MSSFAVLCDSSSSSDESSPAVKPMRMRVVKKARVAPVTPVSHLATSGRACGWFSSPTMVALASGTALWGDIMLPKESFTVPVRGTSPTFKKAIGQADAELVRSELQLHVEALLGFADIHTPLGDIYDFSAITDAEYASVMDWLRRDSWHIKEECREWVEAWPTSNAPVAEWRVVDRPVTPPVVSVAPSAPQGQRRALSPRKTPQFCRNGADCKSIAIGCPFVHGDSIPKINRNCCAGGGCQRRATCLYMHPGEKWVPGCVLRRVIK